MLGLKDDPGNYNLSDLDLKATWNGADFFPISCSAEPLHSLPELISGADPPIRRNRLEKDSYGSFCVWRRRTYRGARLSGNPTSKIILGKRI
jgi:hypothetical protein